MRVVHVSSVLSRAAPSQSSNLAVCNADGVCPRYIKLNIFSMSQVLSAPFQILRHRTLCTLLILCYIFSSSIGLRYSEPQITYISNTSESKLQFLGELTFSEIVQSHKLSRREVERGENNEDNIEYFINHTTSDGDPYKQPVKSILKDSNQSNFAPEKAASIIASSFRNINSQTTNSKESEGALPSERPNVTKKRKMCQGDALKRCVESLPPMNDTGIPTSAEAVNRACRIYDSGISCFDSWAKNCLQGNQRQMVRTSITGAHEMYSFLCKDPKFRADYLKHKECYRRLSPYWDDCSRQFIDGLRRNIRNNFTAFCCIRLEFVTCVSKYSARLCSLEATKFSMKMAETLIRTRTRAPIPDCIHIHPQNCIPMTENGADPSGMHPVCIVAASVNFLAQVISAGYLRNF